jgi:hypothetical protein
MNRMTVVVAFAAALLSGIISRYISPTPVQAQAQTTAPVEVRAQRFALVNSAGVLAAIFTVDQPRPNVPYKRAVRLYDATGKEIWSAGGSPEKLALK